MVKSKGKAVRSKISVSKTNSNLEAAINILLATLKADRGTLYVYNPSVSSLELAAASGFRLSKEKPDLSDINKKISDSAFMQQKPILSNDIRHDAQFDFSFSSEVDLETNKIIAVPLQQDQECSGVIEVINKQNSRDLTRKDINLLEKVSGKIINILINEQNFNRCNHQLYQRNALLDLAKEVNTARELPDLLNFIVVTAAELLDSEASSLLLRKGEVLRFEIAFGEKGTEVKKFEVPLGAGIAGTVALSGKSTYINQAEVEGSGIFKKIDKQSGFITRNLLASPLRVKERIIGVVEVLNRRSKDGYDEDDISLLDSFANIAAIAIERAQLIEKRIEAERLATIGRTVAGLAHCIKNITNALKGGEYIVDKGFRDNNPELLQKGWEITKQGSERIRDLVYDMLTISKKREPEYTVCCPHEIVTEVIGIIKEKAKEKKVAILTHFDEQIGEVKIDKKNIFRCLLNLATNALDASKETDGLLKIETFKMPEKPFFGFRIIDNGQGISEENQKKLFTEFFSTKGSEGTGLGLSVTQSIIREHGGTIKCDSQLGEGTTFTISMPMGQ